MPDNVRFSIPEGPYQLMPRLTDEEFTLLKADIQQRGVVVPIVLDDEGNILDGHHRLACVAQLETETPGLTIPYQTEVRRNLTAEQKRDYVIALNLKRRHLSEEDRLQLLIKLRVEYGKTLQEVADLANMSRTTVWRKIVDAEAAGLVVQPSYITTKDGRLMPASYQAGSFMSYTEMRKEERIEERAASRALPVANFTATENCEIFLGDINDVDATAGRIGRSSVDAIVCDPPYPQEFVPLMERLSMLGSLVLKPGRPLIAMLGHAYLPSYMELLGRHLKYHWTIAGVLGGANSVQHVWQAFVGWKPILVFTNGSAQLPYYFLDLVHGPGPDKEFHVWGQDVSMFERLIYRFTDRNGLVLDPFLGGGTTAVAALRQQRRFVGFDNDPVAINTTMARLAELPSTGPDSDELEGRPDGQAAAAGSG